MIEELKMILDALGDLGEYAIGIVIVFFLYKLVVYLAGASIVFKLISMFINKVHDIVATRLDNQRHVDEAEADIAKNPPPKTSKIGTTLLGDSSEEMLSNILDKILHHDCNWYKGKESHYQSGYLHESDMRWLAEVVDAQIKADRKERKES